MVEPRQARSPVQRAWTLATIAALALTAVGCTMCPDPFDYSGPVPNGAATQNDFRVRSNGILPLGASPMPWPLIVGEGGQPTVAEATPTPVDEAGDETADEELRQTVAVVSESADDVEDEQVLASADGEADSLQPALTPVPAVDAAKQVALEVAGPVEPSQPIVVPAAAPMLPLGETPGWRARRR